MALIWAFGLPGYRARVFVVVGFSLKQPGLLKLIKDKEGGGASVLFRSDDSRLGAGDRLEKPII